VQVSRSHSPGLGGGVAHAACRPPPSTANTGGSICRVPHHDVLARAPIQRRNDLPDALYEWSRGDCALLLPRCGDREVKVADFTLAVPERFKSALRTLAEAEEDHVAALIDSLSREQQNLATSAVAPCIIEAMPHLTIDEATQIVEAILSLMAQERGLGLPRERIASTVAQADNLEVSDTIRPRFAQRLAALLNVPTLLTALKAHDLITEHANVYSRARLFTDIRPVFGDSSKRPPAAAVIVNTLKIEYFDEHAERAAFFVALDRLDLEQLQGVIGRALDKTAVLRNQVDGAEWSLWEYEVERSPDAQPD